MASSPSATARAEPAVVARGARVRTTPDGAAAAEGGADVYRVGIDVGGTFTDLVAVDETGRVTIAKTASTPADPSDGLLEGLRLLARELR
ncbi:MAG TPA: hydantoinase/oxoprolinase N-terminal domain-containing protein, partial [Methylomirabilota bacterium]|nr:hydantoinase/oxoprolinase N-terminal domain-containing protein [Methylomirabilota bacterium]